MRVDGGANGLGKTVEDDALFVLLKKVSSDYYPTFRPLGAGTTSIHQGAKYCKAYYSLQKEKAAVGWPRVAPL